MELRLKEFGTIEITDAARVKGDDILVKSADGFRKIAEATDYCITGAYLVEVNFIWSLVIMLDVLEQDDEDALVYIVENQDDIYRLNARL